MISIRKVMAATAVGAMTLVPLAACSSDDAESPAAETTSAVTSEDSMTETELAQKLGISRKSLWERRQRLGIPRKKAGSRR